MRCHQRLMSPLRAQRREVLRDAQQRQPVECVRRAVINVPTQHQLGVRSGQRREVEKSQRRRPRYPFPSSPTASNIRFSSGAAAA